MYFKSTGLKSSMRQSTVGSCFMMGSVMCQVCRGSECYRARSDFEMSTHFICAYLTSSLRIPTERSGETRADSLPRKKHRLYTNTCSSVWPCACPYITPVLASNPLQQCNHMSYVSQFSYLGHIWDWYKSQVGTELSGESYYYDRKIYFMHRKLFSQCLSEYFCVVHLRLVHLACPE